MKAEYINAFYLATQEVFELMLDLKVDRGNLKIIDDMVCSEDANVHLGVTGDLKGSILFGFPGEMALKMVEIMSGMAMKEIDNFVSSALGEVANIVGGNAITNLSNCDYKCDITPPQIFIGQYNSFPMPNEKALLIPMKTEIGNFNINIFLTDN